MSITFEKYCEEQQVELHEWQQDAARVYLKRVHKVKPFASGKTFLTELLNKFLSEHGNTFDLDQGY